MYEKLHFQENHIGSVVVHILCYRQKYTNNYKISDFEDGSIFYQIEFLLKAQFKKIDK